MITDGTLLLAFKTELRGWGVRTVEIPGGSRYIDARSVGYTILINPYLVFISGKPGRIRLDGLSLNE